MNCPNQASLLPEAAATLAAIADPSLESRVVKLDAAIKYREEDLRNARILVGQFERKLNIRVGKRVLRFNFTGM